MTKTQATYLILKMPDLSKTASHEIEQGYLSDDPDSLRIRKKGSSYLITRKIDSGGGAETEELDMPISQKDFEAFWATTKRSLKKTRYYYSDTEGVNIRIDVFHGKLDGLALAELIFDSSETYKNFKKPDWMGAEITHEKWASNNYFAGSSFSELQRLFSKK